MDVQKALQNSSDISTLTVEKSDGTFTAFDQKKLHASLCTLSRNPIIIRRTEGLVIAQLAGFSLVATSTIHQTVVDTLTLLGQTKLANRYDHHLRK
ncbi:hypothetical protein [Levilactobacillus bambusae]|uniref:ATP-cone domain-containing protein n=1 Tax=Levilactobacillus bambusae TaxID=2024736 RepID=A0A2V1N0F8_9LACO|nr:hypothetical protein [Levilactobacillus bambusae]PWF99829.1 hypothetical protein DCM90_07150 [Levilactobacillus bambusae]